MNLVHHCETPETAISSLFFELSEISEKPFLERLTSQWHVIVARMELSTSEDLRVVFFGCLFTQRNTSSSGLLQPVPALSQYQVNIKEKTPVSGNTVYEATEFSHRPRREQAAKSSRRQHSARVERARFLLRVGCVLPSQRSALARSYPLRKS